MEHIVLQMFEGRQHLLKSIFQSCKIFRPLEMHTLENAFQEDIIFDRTGQYF